MNKITQTKEEGIQKFDREFGTELGYETGYATTVQPRDIEEYQEWLKAHQNTLLQAVLDEVKGRIEDGEDTILAIKNAERRDIATLINKGIGV